MKKMLGLAAVLSVCVNTSAYDFEANGMFYNILSQDDKTVEVTYRDTEYDSYSGDVAIPEQVTYNNETYRVTTIGHFAFNRCSELTSIAIPSSITLIDKFAFLGCEGLTAVYIDDLSAWMNIDIITSEFYSFSPLYYAYNLYLDGELVTDLVIPDGTTEIKDYVFEGGRCFKSVTIPNSVTFIGKRAFSGCTDLTAVNISDLPAWMNINFATSASNPLYTPTNVYHNLYLNGELVTDLVIPDGTTEIKDYAFAYGNFKSVTIPGSVTSIGNGAFENCTNLTSIEIPDKVTVIGNTAFYGCSNLSSVTIGESVTSITGMSFYLCDNIKTVYCKPTVPPIVGSRVFTTVVFENAELCVPTGSADEYRLADEWRNFLNISEMDFGGIADLSGDNVTATAINGNIVINCNYETSVQVYKISGQLIYNGTDSVIAGLANGIYIVKVAGQTFKVAL